MQSKVMALKAIIFMFLLVTLSVQIKGKPRVLMSKFVYISLWLFTESDVKKLGNF